MTQQLRLETSIISRIEQSHHDVSIYEDLFALARSYGNTQQGLQLSQKVRNLCKKHIRELSGSAVSHLVDLSNRTLLFEAPHLLNSYMQYLEVNRAPEERFYLPRYVRLKPVIDLLQDLEDNKLDELFISMPPRVGKTTLLLFLTTWLISKHPENTNLYSAYSDIITNSFFSGVYEVLNDSFTYMWRDVFPELEVASTNAKLGTISVNRKKRYNSITCRSLHGTLNGSCDCNGYLIIDDPISGIEEALNPARLQAAWAKVDNNLLPRAKESAKIIWVGTRWSLKDPIGVRQTLLQEATEYRDRRFKIINLPALDPITEESNFEYKYGVGFSTQFYIQRRASFERNNDMASWLAQYQGEPIERAGALFNPSDMKFYNGVLPSEHPDRIFMAIDPAFGGGDFVSAPIAYQYGDAIYIHDVVYDPGDKKVTRPRIASKILEHKVQAARFESNNGGEDYKEWVEMKLTERGYRLNITSRRTLSTKKKEMRIYDKAPEIREFYFRQPGCRSKDYVLFMQHLFSYTSLSTGRKQWDDAPDSLSMLADMIVNGMNPAEIFDRPF